VTYHLLNAPIVEPVMACLRQQAPYNGARHSFSAMHTSPPSFASFSSGTITTTTGVHAESTERTFLVFPCSIHTGSRGAVKANAKIANHFQKRQLMPAQSKTMQTWPTSRPPSSSDLPCYTRARRPALIPHTSSLSLSDASEIVSQRIGAPLLPPPDLHRISYLTSNMSEPGSYVISNTICKGVEHGGSHHSNKRKYSALLLSEESGRSCGMHGCGDNTGAKRISSIFQDDNVLSSFGDDSLFEFGKAGSNARTSAGDVSPLSQVVDIVFGIDGAGIR
jgi:hypothetical protein